MFLRSFKQLGPVSLKRLHKAIEHRLRFTRSDDENCTLCKYYKKKREHCRGCPAFDIYVSVPSKRVRTRRTPYITLCKYYQSLTDDSAYSDGTALPAEQYVERVYEHKEFLQSLKEALSAAQPRLCMKPSEVVEFNPPRLGLMPGPTELATGYAPTRVSAEYVTDSSTYNIRLGAATLLRQQVPVDIEFTRAACLECKKQSQNLGCPPYAPEFDGLVPDARWLALGWATFPTSEWKRAGSNLPPLFELAFTDRLMAHLVVRTVRKFAEDYQGQGDNWPLATGACIACRKCAALEGKKACANPKGRLFSLEATGVRVDHLMAMLGEPLRWHIPGSGKTVQVTHVFGVLGNWEGASSALIERWIIDSFKEHPKIGKILKKEPEGKQYEEYKSRLLHSGA